MLLAFVRSGMADIGFQHVSQGGIAVMGDRAYYWSSTAMSSDAAYNLILQPSFIASSDSRYRWGGYSLRCLYPGSA